MAHDFKKIESKILPARRRRAKEKAKAIMQEMRLSELESSPTSYKNSSRKRWG